jgi:(S)-sulfolactate dehydrogenase
MPEIVICEFMDEAAIVDLKKNFSVLYDPDLLNKPKQLLAATKECRALIVRNRTQVKGDLLNHAKSLMCVGRLGVGLDNIDLDACTSRGIKVFPASGANDLSVAEYVITSCLILLRKSWLSTPDMINGNWPRQALTGNELSGKTIGLIGFGAIAQQVAIKAHDLGMACIAYDPFLNNNNSVWNIAQPHPLQELLAKADVVSLHVPLNKNTFHLINAKALAQMKSTAILINSARGGVVDENALAEALRTKKLGGAALDVFETEPLTREAGQKFVGISNLLLTPHIAGVTKESNVRVSALTAHNVSNHLKTLSQ